MNNRHVALSLLFIITVAYLAFLTRVYYWDGIAFAQAIEDASGLKASLVHPNHLIYNFAGYFFYKLLRTLGAEIRAITALQILNSLLSAASAGILFLILRDSLRSLYLSVCLTLLFAFSATWWKFSTDANAYIPSILFLLISFNLILPERKPRTFLLAVTFFISMAFHQLAVLMLPVLAWGVYLQGRPLPVKRRVLNVAYFSALALVLIVATYFYLYYLASGTLDVRRLIKWTASYSPDADTGFDLLSNLKYSLRGQVRLFFGGRFNLLKGLINPLVVVLIICLVGAVGLLIFDTLRNVRRIVKPGWLRQLCLEPRQMTVLSLATAWSAIYLIFLFFWLPQNTFYRLFYLPALILLFGLGIDSVPRKEAKPLIPAALVVAVALANFLFLIYPFSQVEKFPPLAFALQMNREWPAGTVVYYGAENSDEGLVRYFNPATRWKLLRPESKTTLDTEIAEIYSKGGSAWLETTAIDQFASSAGGAQWLNTHTRKESWRELNDGAYKIRFVQLVPGDR